MDVELEVEGGPKALVVSAGTSFFSPSLLAGDVPEPSSFFSPEVSFAAVPKMLIDEPAAGASFFSSGLSLLAAGVPKSPPDEVAGVSLFPDVVSLLPSPENREGAAVVLDVVVVVPVAGVSGFFPNRLPPSRPPPGAAVPAAGALAVFKLSAGLCPNKLPPGNVEEVVVEGAFPKRLVVAGWVAEFALCSAGLGAPPNRFGVPCV